MRLQRAIAEAILHAHDGKEASMKKQFIIYPFLFGLFFVLALYSANVSEVSPAQVVVPGVVVLGSTLALLAVAWLAFKDVRKAALLVVIILILCFSFGHVLNLALEFRAVTTSQTVPSEGNLLFIVWMGIIGASFYLLRRTRRDLSVLTRIFNIVGVALVIVPILNIAVQEVGGTSRQSYRPGALEVELQNPATLPDIYYIILDRYAAASTLEGYGFDNGEFMDYLSDKGFYVASESCSNYQFTAFSLASSLNMSYLDDLSRQVGETATDLSPLYTMVQDYEVWQLMKSAGYEFIHVGDWWEVTRVNKHADININYRGDLPEFAQLVIRTTMLDPVGTTLKLWGDPRRTGWERVQHNFDEIAQITAMKEPTFVFAHFICPHPNYVFHADGSFVPATEEWSGNPLKLYIDQVTAVNAMVTSLVERLIAESETPPIIILQSDEGPYPGAAWKWSAWENAADVTEAEVRQKMRILNAYYFPGVDRSSLYQSISPVNSFRLLFDLYFRAGLELLPDRSYVFFPGQPYKYYDVTDNVTYK